MYQIIEIILASLCFGSFIWGLIFFFRSTQKTGMGMKLITAYGLFLIILHMNILIEDNEERWISTAISSAMYFLSLTLFWSAVYANRYRSLNLAFSNDVPNHLIRSGPYRRIRHPFYTSYILAWLGNSVATEQIWLVAPSIVLFILYTVAARKEETNFMNSSLHDEYLHYKKTTGLFWPALGE